MQEIYEIIREADADGDGNISYEEFINLKRIMDKKIAEMEAAA